MKQVLKDIWQASGIGEARDINKKLNFLTGLEWAKYEGDEGTEYNSWINHPAGANAVRDKLNEIFGGETSPFYINSQHPSTVSVPLKDVRIVRNWDMSYAGIITSALADAARAAEPPPPKIPPRLFVIL